MVPQLKQWTVSIFFFWGGGCYPRGLLHHNLIGIENLLRRYDTIKTWNDEISLNFPELFIIGKYVKISLKTRGHHAIFWVLEVNRSKILQKWKKDTVFVYILGFIFYGASRAKTDLHNKYMI